MMKFMHLFSIPSGLRSRPSLFLGGVAIFLIAALYLPHLGTIPISGEEPRRALIARHMIESGDYLVPYMAGNIYTAKPPAYNWFICFTSLLGGGEVTEWSARLTSVLSVALLAPVLLFATRHVLGFAGQAMLVLATVLSPYMVHKGTLAEIDMAFTFSVTASLWVWFLLDAGGKRGFALWALPAALAALSFMIKREPGLVFHYLGIYSYLVLQKRWREIFSVPQLASVGLALGLIGLWIGYFMFQTSPEFVWNSYFGELTHHVKVSLPWVDMVKRFIAYPFQVFGTLLPFGLFLIPLIFPAVHRRLFERYGNGYVFSLCLLVVNFPVYWFTTGITRYFMPMYPTLFILGAMVFETCWEESNRLPRRVHWLFGNITRVFVFLLAGVGLCLVASPVVHGLREMPYPWLHSGVTVVAGMVLMGVAYTGLKSKEAGRVCFLTFACLLLGIRLLQFSVLLPHEEGRVLKKKNGPAAARSLVSQLPEGTREVLVYARHLANPVYFYAKEIQFKRVPGTAEELHEPNWVVVDERDLPQFTKTVSDFMERGRFEYRNNPMVIIETGQGKQSNVHP